MKHLLFVALATPMLAQELTTDTLDAGGGLTTGGDVVIAGSLGGFSGLSSDAGPVNVRAGFSGQIYDPVHVAITPGTAILAENDFAAFTAIVVCDDDTLLSGHSFLWSADSVYLNVTSAGEVSTGLVPEPFAATLTATVTFGGGGVVGGGGTGVSGTAILSINDPDSDNYGDYAGDGLSDAWQILYFGFSNPNAAPSADPDADGQDNRTEYFVSTDPLSAASFFALRFDPNPAPGIRDILFSPYLQGRSYTLEWSASLTGPWTALPDNPSPADTPGEGRFTDTAPAETRKYYRLRIAAP